MASLPLIIPLLGQIGRGVLEALLSTNSMTQISGKDRWDSLEAKLLRELFLALCCEDAPERYEDVGYSTASSLRQHRSFLSTLLRTAAVEQTFWNI